MCDLQHSRINVLDLKKEGIWQTLVVYFFTLEGAESRSPRQLRDWDFNSIEIGVSSYQIVAQTADKLRQYEVDIW